jgi:hypothetical protein
MLIIHPYLQLRAKLNCEGAHQSDRVEGFLKPVFHSRISPPLAKNFDEEIIFLHSFAAEEICSPATVA